MQSRLILTIAAAAAGYLVGFETARPRDMVEISRTADRAIVREFDQWGKSTAWEKDLNAPVWSVFRTAKPPDYRFEMVLHGAMTQPLDLREVTPDRCLVWVSEDALASAAVVAEAFDLCVDASHAEAERGSSRDH